MKPLVKLSQNGHSTVKILFSVFFGFLLVVAIGTLLGFLIYRVGDVDSLGSKLKYIGKESGGCVLFLCFNEPYTNYYFKTNMTKTELSRYFKKARFIESHSNSSKSTLKFSYENPEQSTLELNYYKDSNNQYVVEMADFNYKWFKQAL